MFRLLLVTALAGFALAQSSADGGVSTTLGGTTDGAFEFLGSLCFPAGSKSKITVTAKTTGALSDQPNLTILFYDDQPGSFDDLMRTGSTCSQNVANSKQLCSGPNSCVNGYKVNNGAPMEIQITEAVDRQWYFVASDCNQKNPVDITYTIHSDTAIDCQVMKVQPSAAGYVVAIVFLVIFVAILATTTVIFYKKSQGPGGMGSSMPENYEQL